MPTDPMWCFENYGEAAEYIDQLEKQRDELLAHIPEWHCKTCNTIHLPPNGFNLCCPTPKCTGLLKPSSQAIRIVEAQRDELLAALEQERKRLDWALANDAQYFMWDGEMTFCCSLDHGCGMYTFVGETNDPRPEIDEFMESQALTERKS